MKNKLNDYKELSKDIWKTLISMFNRDLDELGLALPEVSYTLYSLLH